MLRSRQDLAKRAGNEAGKAAKVSLVSLCFSTAVQGFIEHTGPRGTARSCTESEAGLWSGQALAKRAGNEAGRAAKVSPDSLCFPDRGRREEKELVARRCASRDVRCTLGRVGVEARPTET